MEFWEDVLSNLIGAGVGALCGAFLGYWFGLKQEYKMRENEEKDNKNQLIKSLINEISENKEYLKNELKEIVVKDETVIKIFDVKLLTHSFESGVFSGRFSLLSPETQSILSNYYLGCSRMNDYLSRFETGNFQKIEQVKVLSSFISDWYDRLKKTSNSILLILKSELSPNTGCARSSSGHRQRL